MDNSELCGLANWLVGTAGDDRGKPEPPPKCPIHKLLCLKSLLLMISVSISIESVLPDDDDDIMIILNTFILLL